MFHLQDGGRKIGFGKLGGNYRLEDISFDFSGTSFTLNHNGVKTDLRTALVGEFNAYNAAAYVLMVEAGIDGIMLLPKGLPKRHKWMRISIDKIREQKSSQSIMHTAPEHLSRC